MADESTMAASATTTAQPTVSTESPAAVATETPTVETVVQGAGADGGAATSTVPEAVPVVAVRDAVEDPELAASIAGFLAGKDLGVTTVQLAFYALRGSRVGTVDAHFERVFRSVVEGMAK